MRNEPIEKLESLLETPQDVVIIPHKNPDGDAIGSCLALYHYLLKRGHSCTVISPNNYPNFLQWLPGNETVKFYDTETADCEKLLNRAELIFTLDFNEFSRTSAMRPQLQKVRDGNKAIFVMIDHHEQPDDYAEYRYSVVKASSTCELIYNCISKFGDTALIDASIATCLYVGIMTDTGSFKFSSTTGQTHRVVADLIDKGANNALIHQRVYDTKTYDQLQLLGVALNNLRVIPDKKAAYITLSQKELDQHHYRKGDTEGIVNYGLSLKGIILTAIFIEDRDEQIIKISLRSKGDFNVNEVARKYFNGGGHKNAAGGKSLKTLEETAVEFETLLNRYETLDNNAK